MKHLAKLLRLHLSPSLKGEDWGEELICHLTNFKSLRLRIKSTMTEFESSSCRNNTITNLTSQGLNTLTSLFKFENRGVSC